MDRLYEAVKQVCKNYANSSSIPSIFEALVVEAPPDDEAVKIMVSDTMTLPDDSFVISDCVGELKKGDKLIAARAAGGQKYFLIGKVR